MGAWVKLEGNSDEDTIYQWVVLVPFEGAANGWTCTTVLRSSAPVSHSAELLAQPVGTAGDARVSKAALPPSVTLAATFASGVLLSGCFFGRKELYAKLMAPSGLREPLL